MKFYFLWKVLKCIALYFSLFGDLFSSDVQKFPFSWENGAFIWRRALKDPEVTLDYLTMFAVSASYCVFMSPLALVSAVLHSHILNDMTRQHSQFSQLTSELRLMISFESIVLHPQHTHSLVIETRAQTDINSGCKAFCELCCCNCPALVFVLWEARACDDAFFSIVGLFYLQH